MGQTPKIKVGIVGTGRNTNSIGFNIAWGILKNDFLFHHIDAILLNNRDEDPSTVIDHINLNLCHALDDKTFDLGTPMTTSRETHESVRDYFKSLGVKKLKSTTQSQIAQEAAFTFICAEARYGASHDLLPVWEANVRKKLLKGNLPIIRRIAENFKGAFGQCIIVTNPCLNVAKIFQETAGLEVGQVLAYNPDYMRFCEQLLRLEKQFPDISSYINKLFLVGDHGGLTTIAPKSVRDDFCKKFPNVNLETIVNKVMAEGLYIVENYGNVNANIVPHMIAVLINTILENDEPFVWGMPYCQIWCSQPLVNKRIRTTSEGYPVYRARVLEEVVNKFKNDLEFITLKNDLAKDQEIHDLKVEESIAVVRLGGANKLTVCGYGVKSLDILCNNVITTYQVNNDELVLATCGYDKKRGKFSNLSRLKLVLQNRINQPQNTITPAPDCELSYPFVDSLTFDEENIFVGVIEGEGGFLAAYGKGKILRGPIQTNFKPYALKATADCIYCADDTGIIRKLNKNTLKEEDPEKTRLIVKGLENHAVQELFYLEKNGKIILCARAYPANNKSTVAVLQNRQQDLFEVQNSAFYATLLNDMVALFYCADNEVRMRFLENAEENSLLQNVPVCSLGFDSKYNYLYVCSGTGITIYPYSYGKLRLNHMKEFNLNMNMKLSEMKVGRLWEQ